MSFNLELLKYFEYKHLPEKLQRISKEFYLLAYEMNMLHEQGQLDPREANAGIRKLLEAKDCFVRASLREPVATVKVEPNKEQERCPHCDSLNLMIERRPNGNVSCIDCGAKWNRSMTGVYL